jgi:hypothetical protein
LRRNSSNGEPTERTDTIWIVGEVKCLPYPNTCASALYSHNMSLSRYALGHRLPFGNVGNSDLRTPRKSPRAALFRYARWSMPGSTVTLFWVFGE